MTQSLPWEESPYTENYRRRQKGIKAVREGPWGREIKWMGGRREDCTDREVTSDLDQALKDE